MQRNNEVMMFKMLRLNSLVNEVVLILMRLNFALVNQILSTKQEKNAADTLYIERQIDELVYGLYGLTEKIM